MNDEKNNLKGCIKLVVFAVILGIVHAFVSLFADISLINLENTSDNRYVLHVLGAFLAFSWIYTYIKEFVRYYISRKENISQYGDIASDVIYVLVSLIALILLNRYRNFGEYGDAVAYTVVILDAFLVYFKSKFIRDGYFFEKLLLQEKFVKVDKLKDERKKQIKYAKYGFIYGLLSIIILVFNRLVVFSFVSNKMGDIEFGIFATIVATIVLHCIYVEWFNKHTLSKQLKDHDSTVSYSELIVDIAENAFKVAIMLGYFIVLVILNMNIALTAFIVLGIKIVTQFKLWGASNPDYTPSTTYTPTYEKEEKKPELTINTGYVKDQFGNIVGKTETYGYSDKYGGFETTEYKDNFGNVKGKSDTYKF